MKKTLSIISLFAIICFHADSQELADSLKYVELEEVVVSSVRANKKSAVSQSNLSREEIRQNNAAKNIPLILQALPSVVAYSEDGLGLGNTQYRIRGTDANRINVTLNGMPLNNPESQDVFWVNIPDLSNSLSSIQIQRGVGTASNGAASFGGSISLQSSGARTQAYGEASSSLGSYNSFLASIAAGSGVMKNGLSIDGRFSYASGDGYIRNGKVNHKNGTFFVLHYTDKQLIRLSYINAIQHTGITWKGASPEALEKDRKHNPEGQYMDEMDNIKYYDNETDNYYSHIAQAMYSRNITKSLKLNFNLSYNNGYGYYENYKTKQLFSKFGLQNQIVKGKEYKLSDIIRRKLMSNNLYIANTSLEYKWAKLRLSAGSMYSYYTGSHYGQILWAKYNQNIDHKYEWYRNTARKRDINAFIKSDFEILSLDRHELIVSAEVQYRYIDYAMHGIDDDLAKIDHNNYYSFTNPKFGLSYSFLDYNKMFFSFGLANREPLRADLKDYYKSGERIKPEQLYDYELGYSYVNSKFSAELNLYYMDYNNQLVQTGRLSDSGYKLQENVKNSYRMGVELAVSYSPTPWLKLDANTNMSRNKIKNYTAYYESYDNQTDWNPLSKQISEYIGDTNISFSPSVVANGIMSVFPMKNLSLRMTHQYVGKMYYDNSSKKENRLADYYITNFSASYLFETKNCGKISLEVFVNNLFNKNYIANAWTEICKFADGSEIVYKGLFPQAGTHFTARVSISF